MAEETNDKMQIAVEQENSSLNSMVRQYLEGRVVELNVKLQEAEEELALLRAERQPSEDSEPDAGT